MTDTRLLGLDCYLAVPPEDSQVALELWEPESKVPLSPSLPMWPPTSYINTEQVAEKRKKDPWMMDDGA
jgi:hypothetical protein